MNPMDNKDIQKFVDSIAAELTFSEAQYAVRAEIRSHLEDSIETAKSYGLSEVEAIQDSIKRMGDPQQIGQSLNLIHQPKFDFVLPILAFGLCLIGMWNLSSTNWLALQLVWVAIGIALLAVTYLLSATRLQNFLSSLYICAVVGLAASYFSGVTSDNQPCLSILGLNIKIVDLSAVFFSLALPALSLRFQKSRFPALSKVALFLIPLAYFSLNGFIWAGLLLLISGLCFLGMQKISNKIFLGTGIIGAGLLLSKLSEGLVPIAEVNKAIIENAHTDYALRSLSVAVGAEILAAVLLISILLYGFRLVFSIKEQNFRSIAVVGISLLAIQIVTSVLANLGILPMISAGVNIPFISYGGSGIIANFLIIGALLACFKRKTLSFVDV